MTPDKICKFFLTALERTKTGTLIWTRADKYEMSQSFTDVDCDRSFVSKSGNGGKIYLLKDSVDDSVACFIKPAKELGPQIVGDSDDPTLLRLYNVVYSKFPSIDSFIDSFLSGGDANEIIDK